MYYQSEAELFKSPFTTLSIKNCVLAFLLSTSTFFSYSQNGSIKGKILNMEGPLPLATISAGKRLMLSDEKGEFLFNLQPGKYTLAITHVGYIKVERTVSVYAKKATELVIQLTKDDQLNHVFVLGSRSSVMRTALSTPVPVDVIPASSLAKSEVDLNQLLALVLPSFNSPPQSVGLTAHLNPATLRGLAPDQTLVLLNGRRRHNAAFIYLQNGLGYGTVGTDLNAIPAAAIDTIEVLRDGASAQYGSDAIAGVINLGLKKTTGVTTINFRTGQYYKGDGETIAFSINGGFKLNKNGFINLTADLRSRNTTERGGEYRGTVYYDTTNTSPQEKDSLLALDNNEIARRGFDRKGHLNIGTPQFRSIATVVNGGYSLGKNTSLYWTGTLNYRVGSKGGYPTYCYPKDTVRVITELFPNGFDVSDKIKLFDVSAIAGFKGVIANSWLWDVSSTFGSNSHRLDLENDNNASQFALGKSAQTEFHSGNIYFRQNTNNINLQHSFGNKRRSMNRYTLAFGGEFRIDNYQIEAGEEASYFNYAPGSGRMGGAQILPGFRPENIANKNRIISAAYTELEIDNQKRLLFNVATRYEHYSDFGGNLSGKLALRYRVSDKLLFRGSLGNGFRAPAIQQRYYSSVTTIIRSGILSITETCRNDGDIAKAFGIQPLQSEKSVNASGGFTVKLLKNISLTLDAYWIQIKDRITFTDPIGRSDTTPRIGYILDSLHRKDITAVRFFTNRVNTRTIGMDAMLQGSWRIKKSFLKILLSANFTKNRVYSVSHKATNLPDSAPYSNLLFNIEEKGRIETWQPGNKVILTGTYKFNKWEFTSRNIRYDKVAHIRNKDTLSQYLSPRVVSDVSLAYAPTSWLKLTATASNVFNVYPDKISNYGNTAEGTIKYSQNVTQFGNNGGYYALNMEFNF